MVTHGHRIGGADPFQTEIPFYAAVDGAAVIVGEHHIAATRVAYDRALSSDRAARYCGDGSRIVVFL